MLKRWHFYQNYDLRPMIRRQTDVALSLTKQILRAKAKDSNPVFSPLSIQVVLSLITAGSKGPTLDQLLRFLESKSKYHLSSFSSEIIPLVFGDGSPRGGPLFSLVNGVWVDKSLPFKHSFKQTVKNAWKAAWNQTDQAISEVNLWVETKTNGLFEQLLPPGFADSFTRLIFANALYFKGAWDKKFDARKTKDYDFYLTNGNSVKAPFMTSKKNQFISAYDGFKVLGLPYEQAGDTRQFTMYIFLPDSKHGLKDLVKKLSCESVFLERHLPHESVPVGKFRIPSFKISSGFEACGVVKGLGLVLPFSRDKADLTEIMDDLPEDEKLYVSNIFHKSFVEVNEEWTEAAAGNAAYLVRSSWLVKDNKIDFVADHPFLFMIREDVTGAVLFIGQVLNPLEG